MRRGAKRARACEGLLNLDIRLFDDAAPFLEFGGQHLVQILGRAAQGGGAHARQLFLDRRVLQDFVQRLIAALNDIGRRALGRRDPEPRAGLVARHGLGDRGYVRQIGEEKLDAKSGRKKHPARRWVVERTISWLNRCRGILVRYEKKAENYLAVVQFACALLWYRRLHRLTT